MRGPRTRERPGTKLASGLAESKPLLRHELLNPLSGIDFARIEIPLGIHERHMDEVEHPTLMAVMADLGPDLAGVVVDLGERLAIGAPAALELACFPVIDQHAPVQIIVGDIDLMRVFIERCCRHAAQQKIGLLIVLLPGVARDRGSAIISSALSELQLAFICLARFSRFRDNVSFGRLQRDSQMVAFAEALRRGAPNDDVMAQLELARECDAKGDGEAALNCLRRAAATGDLTAKTALGRHLLIQQPLNRAEGVKLITAAAEEGSGEAAYLMALFNAAGVT